jgi:3-dehydroquinate dehydratase/shikimate dehydrogenase
MRAVPVVEALAAFAILDLVLADEAARPRICLTLTGKTLAEDLAQYASQRYFADMVELRVDLLGKGERARAADFPRMIAKASPWKVPVVLTFRRACDGGAFRGPEKERLAFFERVLAPRRGRADAGFSYVDFEEDFGGEGLLRLAHDAGAQVVRSLHKFDGPVKNLKARLRALGRDGDVAKVAFMPRDARDVSRLMASLDSRFPVPRVVVAMGELGVATRVQAGRLGSLWTYASVGGLGKLGHLTPYEIKTHC